MVNYLALVSEQMGLSVWLLIFIVVWTLSWKLTAMYIAARKKSIPWFIALAIINTTGILPIFYIFLFSKMKVKVVEKPLKEKKKKPKNKSVKKKS